MHYDPGNITVNGFHILERLSTFRQGRPLELPITRDDEDEDSHVAHFSRAFCHCESLSRRLG